MGFFDRVRRSVRRIFRPSAPPRPEPEPEPTPFIPGSVGQIGRTPWLGRDDWSRFENQQWDRMALSESIMFDPQLQEFFDIGFFDRRVTKSQRKEARDFLRDELRDRYGINFDDIFDWEEWRERYEGEFA